MTETPAHPLRVYLEVGKRRVFAVAVDWPGWARIGRDPEDAVDALLRYRDRYARVTERAGLAAPSENAEVDVLEEIPLDPTAKFVAPDFGTLQTPPTWDASAGWGSAEAQRQVALMAAAWAEFEDVVANAPASLRKGPRGGGRNRDAIAEHVLSAEVSYARKYGVRYPQSSTGDPEQVAAWRAELSSALADPDVERPSGAAWTPRYAVRRITWHVLDHAWEIEDRRQIEDHNA